MNRLFFIVNPVAGIDRAAEGFEKVRKMLDEKGIEYAFDFSDHKGHATEIAKEAVQRGEKTIIAVGGDGTVNEVAAALCNTGVTMGILPFGTGNDLAKVLKLPTDPDDALEVILEGHHRCMDAGMANDRFFINVAGFGFDVDVLISTEKYKKRFRGMIPYLMALVTTLSHLRKLHMKFEDGERRWEKDCIIISVGNGTHFGGGMKAVPFADPFDGLLDVSIIQTMKMPRLLTLLPSFMKGKHTGVKYVEYFRTKEITVICPEGGLVNCDGELGGGMPVTFRVLPGAINMLVRQEDDE